MLSVHYRQASDLPPEHTEIQPDPFFGPYEVHVFIKKSVAAHYILLFTIGGGLAVFLS